MALYKTEEEKTTREKIGIAINRLEKYLQKNSFPELCVVFDVGTKGVRVIVGPKMSIEEFHSWDSNQSDIFYAAALDTNLGAEFERNFGKLNLNGKPLEDTILFLRTIRLKLDFISKENFTIVGTAVFRWLENQSEVIERINESTGLPLIRILTQKEEAYYSLLAIRFTHDKIGGGRFPKFNFNKNDVILLFDQGGGSTEVSYLIPSKTDETELTSMFHIGTISLENKFYLKYRTAILEKKFNGETKNYKSLFSELIKDALQRVCDYIEGHVDGLKGFEKITNSTLDPLNIHVYGIGTALKVCFEKYFTELLKRTIYGKELRGWRMTSSEMENAYDKIQKELIFKYGTVNSIHSNVPILGATPAKDLKDKLIMLYGLKAYQMLLKKFGVDTISYAYYNLKHGIFLENYVEGVKKVSSLATGIFTKQEILTAKQRVNALDEIRPGEKDASDFHQFIFESLILIFGDRLSNPVKEKQINDGRKRIDIMFDNTGDKGFFARLNSHHKIVCPRILIECKNTSNIDNPAIDQLAGRFTNNIGNFGFIVCRRKANVQKVTDLCRYKLRDNKFIIVLDDDDIKALLIKREFGQETAIDKIMSDLYDELTL